jgi:hypothetical protein
VRRPWLLLLPLLASPALAQVRGFAVAPDVAVRILNLAGHTRIVGWDRDSIDVNARIPPGGGVLYGGGGGGVAKLGIEAPDPALAVGATLVVRVPRNARVWVKSASASVEIQGARGEVEVSSVTGDVTLMGEPRVATLETIDGDVEVQGAATVLRIRTGAGGVRVGGARGELSVSTVQGPIVVAAADLLSARLESVSGRVDVAGPLPAKGRLEIQTHDGDVRVQLPRPVDARFDIESVTGKVITRLFDQPEREYREGVAKFSVGSSGGTGPGRVLAVRSFKGVIRVDSNPKL